MFDWWILLCKNGLLVYSLFVWHIVSYENGWGKIWTLTKIGKVYLQVWVQSSDNSSSFKYIHVLQEIIFHIQHCLHALIFAKYGGTFFKQWILRVFKSLQMCTANMNPIKQTCMIVSLTFYTMTLLIILSKMHSKS